MPIMPRSEIRTTYDLTRSRFEYKSNFPTDVGEIHYESAVMAFRPRQTERVAYPASGDPNESLLGVALNGEVVDPGGSFGFSPASPIFRRGMEDPFSVIVGHGELDIYTLFYDPTEQIYLGEQVKVVEGGRIASKSCMGKLIEDSMVISLPIGPQDPYLGVRMKFL